MRVPLYQLDVFADRLFAGNPAAVCPLQDWLPDALMQQIAAENNLSETAFFVAEDGAEADFLLRWFTPTQEIELCGHATLASAQVLFDELGWSAAAIRFRTLRAGVLRVERRDDGLWLDLPATAMQPLAQVPAELAQALGAQPLQVFKANDKWVALFAFARTVEGLRPDFAALRALPVAAVSVTAPGRSGEDFVSRYFGPAQGIDEDPATGSAHAWLLPYWAARIGRGELLAAQLSPRGARLRCRMKGERVEIGGRIQPYLRGEIALPS